MHLCTLQHLGLVMHLSARAAPERAATPTHTRTGGREQAAPGSTGTRLRLHTPLGNGEGNPDALVWVELAE